VTSPGAIVLRGSPEQAAFAEWIVREFDQSAAGATHEYIVGTTASRGPSSSRRI